MLRWQGSVCCRLQAGRSLPRSTLSRIEGVGAVLGGGYAWIRWPSVMRSRKECPECGVQWRYKMSMLELVGWTLVVCCFPREILNKAVVVQM